MSVNNVCACGLFAPQQDVCYKCNMGNPMLPKTWWKCCEKVHSQHRKKCECGAKTTCSLPKLMEKEMQSEETPFVRERRWNFLVYR